VLETCRIKLWQHLHIALAGQQDQQFQVTNLTFPDQYASLTTAFLQWHVQPQSLVHQGILRTVLMMRPPKAA
jgi:hypothetical protein